ncbi:Alpha/Beta hydrolase protein [Yarrowia lipolytica]|uniref:triacylglycerol lipase n=1 Tax=Yarrowia lipolytica TaxID=4952 RepID=A0A371C2R3_YARLL|nr:Alpha/Beta hydrolase protein [Yarrowia lipolytica]RDW29866.1 Alpha/Beta hydrolase protein [Yarrowia lipolytica]RDW38144.1 Alpha/Beta hydrolase protein [Yarrowia lipolytica]RDW44140.1 Alpha/Beta hydrolase protein [Yarrowia lipolytica]RDW51072.1 Alpha/Beta hydrolase protein [Yarrowia lipolytica]
MQPLSFDSLLSLIAIFLLVTTALAQTANITQSTYDFVLKYGRLSNVAYCVKAPGPYELETDFTCGRSCGHFPNVTLEHQFGGDFFSTSITGFLAHDHTKKEKYIVFRGTFSLADAITDALFLQEPYLADLPPLNTTNINSTSNSARVDCPDCEIHDGFQKAYRETMVNMQGHLVAFLRNNTDYKLIVTGHSLGAATALLMGINLKNLGFDPMVITFGQPRVGNKAFADYADSLFFKQGDNGLNINPERRLYRVTHWNDIVVGVPFWSGYTHTLGEVYISYPDGVNAPIEYVNACAGPDNDQCHYGSFDLLARVNILKNHCAYLNWIFYCAFNVDKRQMMIDPPRIHKRVEHWSGKFADVEFSERMIYEATYPM